VSASPAKQGSSIQSEATWIDRSVWNDRLLAALDNGVKGTKWYSLMDKVWRRQTLENGWQDLRRNRGGAGVDGQSIERFAAKEEQYLQELEASLRSGAYRPAPVKRVEIPKGNGKKRPLGIPTVKDRIVQSAIKRVIEPIFEKVFEPTSYGFRPNRSCKDALREVDQLLKQGNSTVVDADIEDFFGSISHERMMEKREDHISDGKLLKLLEMYLKQEAIDGLSKWTPLCGTPQGAVISPLLANLSLHELDVKMREGGYRMVRYADDFVVMCRSEAEAKQALEEVRSWMSEHGLRLQAEKTRISDSRQKGQGFEFLGYRFEAGRRWVRKKSMQALKAKIRSKTRRSRGASMSEITGELNLMLRGWFNYFKHAHWRTYQRIDQFVRRRLRAILRKQSKRPGMGWTLRDHLQWPNKYFAEAGLFTMHEAWQTASQSRC
jgi:RNA-directed DNA polymerase